MADNGIEKHFSLKLSRDEDGDFCCSVLSNFPKAPLGEKVAVFLAVVSTLGLSVTDLAVCIGAYLDRDRISKERIEIPVGRIGEMFEKSKGGVLPCDNNDKNKEE